MYILTHGEYSPGGGFQAGALLAVGIVLVRLIQGADKESFNVPGPIAVVCAGVGTFIYAATSPDTNITDVSHKVSNPL